MKPVVKFGAASIVVGVMVLVLKILAARVSGSTALFSDALEALVNVAASSLALYALIVGAKPADREHHYGHAKVELLSAVATGAMILIAAVLIFQRAIGELFHPAPLAPWRQGLGAGLAWNSGWWAVECRLGLRVEESEPGPSLTGTRRGCAASLQ